MESSIKVTYMVAIFMFLIEVRPLEPYLTAYMTGPNGNVSLSEVANSMESIRSYSAVIVTLIMLIISDYLLYKSVIIILTCSLLTTYILIAGSSNLTQLKVSMVFFGSSYCTTTVASCYLFAKIEDIQQFQMSASIAAVGLELGKFFGDVFGQIIVSTGGGSYGALPYYNAFRVSFLYILCKYYEPYLKIDILSVFIPIIFDLAIFIPNGFQNRNNTFVDYLSIFLAAIWAFSFPPIKRKHLIKNVANEKTRLFENNEKNAPEFCDKEHHNNVPYIKYNIILIVIKQAWSDFKISFSNVIVLKKSLWYIFGMAAYVQVITNINVLYSYVVNKQGNIDVSSNGFAESMVTLCGALGAYLIGKVQLDWTVYGNIFTAFCSIFMGTLMMSCYFYDHLLFIYLSYMLYGLISEAILVVTLSEIAKNLKSQRYSLVLGINLLGCLVISAIMTLFFVQLNFLHITIPGRFLYIGGLYIILGIMFFIINLFENNKEKIILY